jgi:hypothetical protein
VYPLLDTIREVSYPPPSGTYGQTIYTGIRPGLRGTQINGTWWLVIMDRAGSSMGMDGSWFRQVRLEITYDQGRSIKNTLTSSHLRFKKNGVSSSPRVACMVRDAANYMALSGTSTWNGIGFRHNLCVVYVDPVDTHGRTVGITDNTGSAQNFAVFTRMTGALADRLLLSASLTAPGSGTAHALYSYLNNPYGTPYIPLSSGSSVDIGSQFLDRESDESKETRKKIFELLNPKNFDTTNTIPAVRSRANLTRSLRDRVEVILSSASSSLS